MNGGLEPGRDDEGQGTGVLDCDAGVLNAERLECIQHQLAVGLAVHEVDLALDGQFDAAGRTQFKLDPEVRTDVRPAASRACGAHFVPALARSLARVYSSSPPASRMARISGGSVGNL